MKCNEASRNRVGTKKRERKQEKPTGENRNKRARNTKRECDDLRTGLVRTFAIHLWPAIKRRRKRGRERERDPSPLSYLRDVISWPNVSAAAPADGRPRSSAVAGRRRRKKRPVRRLHRSSCPPPPPLPPSSNDPLPSFAFFLPPLPSFASPSASSSARRGVAGHCAVRVE